MHKPLKLTEEETLNPFSPEGFAGPRACFAAFRSRKAGWMASQPVSYGIDAGHRLDEDGKANENLRLEDLVSREAWKMAAVLVPIVAHEPEATVLLTLRTAHLSAHSGQIAFPGGKIEKGDATPIETAMREAEEEIGLPRELVTPVEPSRPAQHRHRLSHHSRSRARRSLLHSRCRDPNEVADVFEVPLSFLMEEAKPYAASARVERPAHPLLRHGV